MFMRITIRKNFYAIKTDVHSASSQLINREERKKKLDKKCDS